MMSGGLTAQKAFFNSFLSTKSIAEVIDETASKEASLLPGDITVSLSKKNCPFVGKAFLTSIYIMRVMCLF